MTTTAPTSSASTPAHATGSDPAAVVRAFLLAGQAGDLDAMLELLTDDVIYTNVSLPTMRGRAAVDRFFRPFYGRLHGEFRFHMHTIAVDGQTVLTERTDALRLGPLEPRFWVYGRFEVVNDRIAVWRDSFDWYDITVSLVRGVGGAVIPRLNRRWPGTA